MNNLQDTKNSQPEQEPVTVLPDGSAFAVMSYPLPKDHWLYAERQYECGADEPNELGKPILTHAVCDAVVSAVRYAIRGATNCGKILDFDPDALVQNAVYALCGPYGSPKPKEPEQEPVVGTKTWFEDGNVVTQHLTAKDIYKEPEQEEYLSKAYRLANELRCHLAIAPAPQRTWVGLTEEEVDDAARYCVKSGQSVNAAIRDIEAKLKEKNT